MYGPSGLGVLYMKDKWIDEFTPYQGGGQMIHDVDIDKSTYANGYEKFEAGTPPIAPVIGFSSSLNFMNEVDPNVIYDHEMKLHDYAFEQLSKFNNIKIYGPNKNKGAIVQIRWEVNLGEDIKNLSETFNFTPQFGEFVQYKNLFDYLNDVCRKEKKMNMRIIDLQVSWQKQFLFKINPSTLELGPLWISDLEQKTTNYIWDNNEWREI